MTHKRVQFDFELEFTNGGGLQGQVSAWTSMATTSTTRRWPPIWCVTCDC
jgi:hypothetical protein